jgi:hypothetical protein
LICTYCNHENPDHFYFCGACGKPMRPASTKFEPAFQPETRREEQSAVLESDRAVESDRDREEGRRSGLSTIDPELYPRRTGETPQPVRLPSGYRSSLLGLAPESTEPEYSYLLEDEQPSRWRFVITAVILLLIGGLVYWQVSAHGGISGTRNAFRNAQQQNQQRRADGSRQTAPTADTSAPENSANSSADEAAAPAQTAAAAPAGKSSADTQPAHNAGTPKSAASAATKAADQTASAGSTGSGSAAPANAGSSTPSAAAKTSAGKPKSAVESTKQASLRQREAGAAPADDENTRLAEKYLYGQGVPQDCNRAVGLIKPAAASANPKAQSMLGTMYATGHCVPRDLPTSYRYFALALREQPRNQWVEKDMEMVWNQMTASEKQLATRMAK